MDNQIEEIKSRTDIVDIIGTIVTLKKTGRNFKALCPFHQEKSASFVVSAERQSWHCFGACHEGGDVISFVMKWENITFYEALKELAEKAGVVLKKSGLEDKEWEKKERLLYINTLTARYFEYVLHSTSFGKTALEYLSARNISVAIMKKFQMGYAPRSWDSLLNFLTKKGYNREDIHEAGLLVKKDTGRFYDRFRGRIMFPISDIRGNIIGFSGRLIEHSDVEGKYINTPETPVYRKRESLYGIQIAKEAIRKADDVLLVEGEFDMITPYIHGIDNIVAIKGSAVTREQLTILKRLTKRITLALDADSAGEDAMKRGIEEAERQEFEIRCITFEHGKDPDEAARTDLLAFKKALKNPLPVYDFIINLAQKKFSDGSAFSKKNIGDFVTPFISRIQNPIVQSHYSKKLSAILDVSEGSIISLIRQQRFQKKPFIARKSSQIQSPREEVMERYLISVMLQHENSYEVSEKIFVIIKPEEFSFPAYQKVCIAFLEYKARHMDRYGASDFVSTLTPELVSTYDELFMFSSSEGEFSSGNIDKLIYEVKKNILKRKISAALSHDGTSTEVKEVDIAELSKTLREVENRIQTL